MSSNRTFAAQHEASHAVAAWLLGRRVELVTLAGGPWGNPCVIDHPADDDPPDLEAAVADMTCFAVGVIGSGQPVVPDGARDYLYLGGLAHSVAYSDEEAEALQAWIVARARAMVKHPHFAFLVEHIAEALERDGEMDEEDFRIEAQQGELRYRAQPHPAEDQPPSRVDDGEDHGQNH